MLFGLHKRRGISWLTEKLLTSQKELSFIKLKCTQIMVIYTLNIPTISLNLLQYRWCVPLLHCPVSNKSHFRYHNRAMLEGQVPAVTLD